MKTSGRDYQGVMDDFVLLSGDGCDIAAASSPFEDIHFSSSRKTCTLSRSVTVTLCSSVQLQL